MNLEREIARRFSKSLRKDGFNRFTSIVSLASVAIGCIALIVSISILDGYDSLILDTAMRYTSHIEVRSLLDGGIENSDVMLKEISQIEGVQAAFPITVREALVRSRHGVMGAAIHGLPQIRIRQLFEGVTTSGSLPTENGCSIGSSLAQQLAVKVGDTLTFFAAQHQGEQISPILFVVPIVGIISTGMHTVDQSLVAMNDATLNRFFRASGQSQPSVIAVSLINPDDAPQISPKVMEIVGDYSMVFTWRDRFQAISSWIDLQRKPIPVILGLIALVASFTMISTLLVSVVEKTRSISILIALGMTRRNIVRILLIRALSISAFGSMIGSVIALTFALIQHTLQPISLDGSV